MSDASEELKPCPFCGSSDLSSHWVGGAGGEWRIQCPKCSALIVSYKSDVKANAMAAWNRRATNPHLMCAKVGDGGSEI